MGLRSFLTSVQRLIALISKPDRKTLWFSLRICLSGIGIVGIVGYVIKLIASSFQLT